MGKMIKLQKMHRNFGKGLAFSKRHDKIEFGMNYFSKSFLMRGMNMATTYNTAELRRQNRNRVLRYIYSSGRPVTKQDIAQALTLSLPTVGQNL